MTRYTREFKLAIADIVSRKEKKNTTLPQYWIVDTDLSEALGVLIPIKSDLKLNWLIRKLDQRGWQLLQKGKIKCVGRIEGIDFVNLVFHKRKVILTV